MARFGIGVLLLATSCAVVQATPPTKAATTGCAFGDFRSCATLCELGSAESCNNAGAHWELGSGVARDVDAAAKYYARACNAGAAAGCENQKRVRVAKPAAAIDRDLRSDAPTPGTFESTGGLLGTWNATALDCSSGASQTALGALSWAVWSGSGYSLQLHAKSGEVFAIGIQRASPFRSVDVSRQQCSRFDATLRPQTGGTMAADVELDCTTTDGGRVTASIRSAACGGM